MAKTNKKSTRPKAKRKQNSAKENIKTSNRLKALLPGIVREQIFGLNKYLEITILSAVIALVAFVLYYQTVDYSLVYCDDNIFVERFTADVDIPSTLDTTVGATFYRPLLNSSFILDARMATPDTVDFKKMPVQQYQKPFEELVDVSVYHITNLIIHIIGSILVLITLIKLRIPYLLSFILALLFTVHPILTPAVSWISGRNDAMITVMILFSFIFFISYMEEENIGKSLVYLVLHAFGFIMALFTKETASVAGFVYLLYLPFFFKFSNLKNLVMKTVIILPVWFFTGLTWFLSRNAAVSKLHSPDEIGFNALIENFNTIPALVGKIILPAKMIALSSFEPFSIITGWIVIAAIIFVIYKVYKKLQSDNKEVQDDKERKGLIFFKMYNILFGLLWFALFLFPTLFIRIIYVEDFFDYAEHRAYLPMIGIILIIAQTLIIYKVKIKKPLVLAIFALIFIVFTYKSYTYKSAFVDRMTFWGHMTEMYPEKPRGHYDLALGNKAFRDTLTAEKNLLKSLELNPNYHKTYIELMSVYDNRKEYQKVEEYARKMLTIPSLPGRYIGIAYYYLGKSYYDRNLKPESIRFLKEAVQNFSANRLQISPKWLVMLGDACYQAKDYKSSMFYLQSVMKANANFPEANLYMGMNYMVQGDMAKAQEYWQKALDMKPSLYYVLLENNDKLGNYAQIKTIAESYGKKIKNPEPGHYYFLARAYINEGNYDKAIALLEGILSDNNKNNKSIMLVLGDAYLRNKNPEKALESFESILKIDPNYPEAHYFIGNTYAFMKDYDKALESFNKTIELKPNYGNAYNSKATVLYHLKKNKEAEQAWLQSLLKDPDFSNSYLNLIKFYHSTGQEKNAIKYGRDYMKRGWVLPTELKKAIKL